MKTAGWAGLFIASFMVGHFVANPWLYPVGRILLFIKIYISALVAFIILNQVIPYVWRTLPKWQMDFQQSTVMKEENLSGGMRLSFAAAGLSSALERRKEEASPHLEPMPRNLSTSGDGAASAAVTLLTATVAGAAAGKKEDYWKEPDPPRKLVLLPPVKANPEKDSDQGSGNNAECPGEPTATWDAVTEDKANKDNAIIIAEVATMITLEDKAETESIATGEAVHAPDDAMVADTQEMSAEPVDGFGQTIEESVTSPSGAEAETVAIIAPVEVPEELKVEELEFEELEPLVVESDVSVEFVPTAGVIPVAFRRPESDTLERILAMDATGIAAATMDISEEILMNEIGFEAENEDFAVEGTDLSFFSDTILQGGMANGSVDQVAVANEEAAEIIEISEIVEGGASIMAAEEFVDPYRTEQDFHSNASMEQQCQDLELSREQTDEILAMDDSSESECECISVEKTGESTGFDICETVELAQTDAMADISTDDGSLEPVGCLGDQTIEAATTEESPESMIVDDIIELRPVGVAASIQDIGKVEESFVAIPHSYSCRLRCQKPGGLFQGPVLSFYCRFVCRHGNY